MTDEYLYPGLTLTLGVDGERPAARLLDDGCCPNNPSCPTLQGTVCSFIDLLPTGPMWDRQKMEVRQLVVDNAGIPAGGFSNPSMVVYAAHVGELLHDVVTTSVQPMIRESQAHTAVDNLDDWLERLGWVDCYRSECRSSYLATLSPYEYDVDNCGETQYFPTAYTTDFENALKHAIVQSLMRLNRGVIKNLAGINWVIEPLGAVLAPATPLPDHVQDYVDDTANEPYTYLPGFADECDSCFCGDVQLQITNTGTTLPSAPTADTFCDRTLRTTVAAEQTYVDGGGNNVLLYPGVIAAECIARTMMPRPCPNIILR